MFRRILLLVGLFLVGVLFAGFMAADGGIKARCTTMITTVGTITETVVSTVTETVTTSGTTGTTSPSPSGNIYLSPSGSDGNPCTQLAPCASFAHAYAVATSGDTVEVTAGTYPAQVVNGGTKAVTFHGQPGNMIRQLASDASNITFDGLDVNCNAAQGVGACFASNGGDNLAFLNGRIGNLTDDKGALIDGGTNIRIENTTFHDVFATSGDVHNECLYGIVVPSMVLRDNTFTNCVTMDAFFTFGYWWSPQPPNYGNVTVEGNTFWHSTCGGCSGVPAGWHYYGFVVAFTGNPSPGPLFGWKIRNNWFENDPRADPADDGSNVFCGNTGPAAPAAWQTPC